MANTRDRITDTAENVRPFVERAVKDEEVRENVKNAFAAARNIYDELIGARGVAYAATRMATDNDLQDSLRAALDDLRNAADRVQGRDTHTGRNVILLVTGIALGLLFNPGHRALDAPLALRPGPREGRVRRHVLGQHEQ